MTPMIPKSPKPKAVHLEVREPKPLAVHQLQVGERVIPVEIYRNERGSVAARCRFSEADTPIIDGPTEAEVMATVQDSIEGLLFVRTG